MQQRIHVSIEDKPGALMRVTGILTAKGCNIRSLRVDPDPVHAGLSQIFLIAEVEERLQTRVITEMNRLVNVLLATDITSAFEDVKRAAC